jgi:hypothetical protein
MTQRGNLCILNPYCEDPESEIEINKRDFLNEEILKAEDEQ